MAKTGTSKASVAGMPVYVMTSPKGAMSEQKFEDLKQEFEKAGITLIIVKYNNNCTTLPRFEKMVRMV
jgi:hypothetical protein